MLQIDVLSLSGKMLFVEHVVGIDEGMLLYY